MEYRPWQALLQDTRWLIVLVLRTGCVIDFNFELGVILLEQALHLGPSLHFALFYVRLIIKDMCNTVQMLPHPSTSASTGCDIPILTEPEN